MPPSMTPDTIIVSERSSVGPTAVGQVVRLHGRAPEPAAPATPPDPAPPAPDPDAPAVAPPNPAPAVVPDPARAPEPPAPIPAPALPACPPPATCDPAAPPFDHPPDARPPPPSPCGLVQASAKKSAGTDEYRPMGVTARSMRPAGAPITVRFKSRVGNERPFVGDRTTSCDMIGRAPRSMKLRRRSRF